MARFFCKADVLGPGGPREIFKCVLFVVVGGVGVAGVVVFGAILSDVLSFRPSSLLAAAISSSGLPELFNKACLHEKLPHDEITYIGR